VALQGL